uniref:Synaptonemal complex protein 1 n=1 Tax=Sinocyclocheilus grahami TaxID=75366 RepID=A0A672RM69_SINGR
HSMQKPFNFKLLVPPRAHLNQISAVKPQETGLFEDNPGFSPSNQVGKLVNSLFESSQLYSRLLDEAEKIKMWKFKIDSEISQKDRKLQENRKTIETQRKAIQELQFANESLSMKLEDQLNENEDLRNKSNATRNLCNILKDTFERSAEKINLFEAEREETHDLFIQNSENIRVAMLQEKLQEKENNLKDVSLKLKEAQQSSSVIEESESKNVQKLKETAMEALKSKDDTEIKCQQKISDMVALMERHKHEYDKMLEEKDAELSEKRMREAEVNASKELELSHLQVENDDLRQQLEKLKGEKVALRTPVSSLEKDTLPQVLYLETVNEDLHTPLWSKTTKTTPQIKVWGQPEQFALLIIHLEHLYESVYFLLQSFRIRTPPSPKIAWSWKENILKLDPKSDNSDISLRDLLNQRNLCNQKTKTQGVWTCSRSSFPCKSPGTVLKLAAIKRMRDAGWTTVSNSDKKKKKATDKIFA